MQKKLSSLCLLLFTCFSVWAQHPVKFELLKVAEATVLPAYTSREAYVNNRVDGRVDSKPMFGAAEHRFNQIFSGINDRTMKQVKSDKRSENVLMNAHEAGFENMSMEQQQAYLKANPALQRQVGVDPSAMELASKMQDPAFQKKLASMSDAEKAKFLQPYVNKSATAADKSKAAPNNIKLIVRAGKLINEFNATYKNKDVAAVELELQQTDEKLENEEEALIAPLQAERAKLPPAGKGCPAWATEKRIEIDRKILGIRNNTWEKKMKTRRETIAASIALFKVAARPFDDFLASLDYGGKLQGASSVQDLAKLGGYQEGLFRLLHRLQELSKDVTIGAATFYDQELTKKE